MEILVGAAASAATATTAATAATTGLLGTAGAFSFGTTLGTLGTLTSVGSLFLDSQSKSAQAAAERTATETNAAIEASNSAKQEASLRREASLREGAARAAAGAQGRGTSGSVLDILSMNTAQSELDILGVRQNNQVTQSLAKSRVAASKKSSNISKYTGILSGVSKIASQYA